MTLFHEQDKVVAFEEKARRIVSDWIMVELVGPHDTMPNADDIKIVWACKTLQNWKAMVAFLPESYFFEVTYNGDKKEIYLDAYRKHQNVVYKEFDEANPDKIFRNNVRRF